MVGGIGVLERAELDGVDAGENIDAGEVEGDSNGTLVQPAEWRVDPNRDESVDPNRDGTLVPPAERRVEALDGRPRVNSCLDAADNSALLPSSEGTSGVNSGSICDRSFDNSW